MKRVVTRNDDSICIERKNKYRMTFNFVLFHNQHHNDNGTKVTCEFKRTTLKIPKIN